MEVPNIRSTKYWKWREVSQGFNAHVPNIGSQQWANDFALIFLKLFVLCQNCSTPLSCLFVMESQFFSKITFFLLKLVGRKYLRKVFMCSYGVQLGDEISDQITREELLEALLNSKYGKTFKRRFVSLNLPIDKIQHHLFLIAHPAFIKPKDAEEEPTQFINCQTLKQISFPKNLKFHQNPFQVYFESKRRKLFAPIPLNTLPSNLHLQTKYRRCCDEKGNLVYPA